MADAKEKQELTCGLPLHDFIYSFFNDRISSDLLKSAAPHGNTATCGGIEALAPPEGTINPKEKLEILNQNDEFLLMVSRQTDLHCNVVNSHIGRFIGKDGETVIRTRKFLGSARFVSLFSRSGQELPIAMIVYWGKAALSLLGTKYHKAQTKPFELSYTKTAPSVSLIREQVNLIASILGKEVYIPQNINRDVSNDPWENCSVCDPEDPRSLESIVEVNPKYWQFLLNELLQEEDTIINRSFSCRDEFITKVHVKYFCHACAAISAVRKEAISIVDYFRYIQILNSKDKISDVVPIWDFPIDNPMDHRELMSVRNSYEEHLTHDAIDDPEEYYDRWQIELFDTCQVPIYSKPKKIKDTLASEQFHLPGF